MKFTKTIEINNNISFLAEVDQSFGLATEVDVAAHCNSNKESSNATNDGLVHLDKDNVKLSILYTNGLGDTLHLDKANIAQMGYGKPVLILKNTFISIKENTHSLSTAENPASACLAASATLNKQKRLSIYDCLEDKNFELVLAWLLQNGLLDDMNHNRQNKQNHFDVFAEYPNLAIFQNSLSNDCLNHYQSALFSPKNWLLSNKKNNLLLPFYFEKKEHFNYFKMLDKEIVDYLVSNNRTMNKDGHQLDAVPLFISLMSYLPNQELIQKYHDEQTLHLQQGQINTNLTIVSICHLYDVFLSLFLNTGKSSEFDYNLFIQLFDKRNKLNTLFYLFLSDFLSTIENDALYQERKELDFDLIQYKKEIYQKILLVCYDANLTKDKLGKAHTEQHDCITFFKNIESKKNSNIQSLLKCVLDYEEYLNYRLNISFIEHCAAKNTNEKTIGLIFDKPFLFQKHIFVPLSNSYDFYMESEYMKNCVKGKEARSYIYGYVRDYNLSLFFHIVDINHLDKQWLETRFELDKCMDFSTIDTTLHEIHQKTKASEQSMLTHINLHTKENILYDKQVINGAYYELESKFKSNKFLHIKQRELIGLFVHELNQINKTRPFDLFFSNI